MHAEQLELNLFGLSDEEIKLEEYDRRISKIEHGFGKVSRKLFYQIHEMNKLCESLRKENIELKEKLSKLYEDKNNCTYGQESYILNV